MTKIEETFQPRQSLNSWMNSKEWQDLVDQIIHNRGADDQKTAFAFVCCSDTVTKRVMNKIKSAIDQHPEKNVLNWREIKFPSFSQSQASDINQYYKQLMELVEEEKRNIPPEGTTIIALYEPINFDYTSTDSKIDNKPRFHTVLRDNLIGSNNRNRLLLFGNIPYELVHIGVNSPLRPLVNMYYIIDNIKPTFIHGFERIEESTQEHIIDCTDGHLDILPKVEEFFENIDIPERLTGLMKHYLSVPIKALQRELVEKKLADLGCLISKNNLSNASDIDFDGEQCEIQIKNSKERQELLNSYFMRTSLFDSIKKNSSVIIKPKERFLESIKDSGFFEKKGMIDQSPDTGTDWDQLEDEMGLIRAFFSKKIERSNPVFILGAGTSIASGAQVNIDFMNSILSDIFEARGKEYKKIQDIDKLTKHFWKEICNGNPASIRNIVTPKLEELQPSIGHFYLAQMVYEEKIRIILTTNFDNLIEDSLMDFGIRSRGFIKFIGKENPNWEWVNHSLEEKVKIFKLCGDLFYGPSLALTECDACSWIKNTSDTLSKILYSHICDKFVILGHSFKERALRNWLESFSSRCPYGPIRIAFINPDNAVCTEFENYCRKFCPEPILIHGNPGKFNNFMEKLHERVRIIKT